MTWQHTSVSLLQFSKIVLFPFIQCMVILQYKNERHDCVPWLKDNGVICSRKKNLIASFQNDYYLSATSMFRMWIVSNIHEKIVFIAKIEQFVNVKQNTFNKSRGQKISSAFCNTHNLHNGVPSWSILWSNILIIREKNGYSITT